MPNTKSAIKAVRGSERKKAFNQRTKNKMRQTVKSLSKAIASGEKNAAQEQLPKAMSALDKAAKKGVIKKNTASRRKSRLSKKVDNLSA